MFSLVTALALLTPNSEPTHGRIGSALPYSETVVSQLAPTGFRHHEALRVLRDFGDPEYALVVDAWTDSKLVKTLSGVRLWWVRPTRQDRRAPLSQRVQKYVEIRVDVPADDHWRVRLRGDRKEFVFDVEVDRAGHAYVFADVQADNGRRIRHCRTASGKILARRFLGIPIGIAAFEVTCVDRRGEAHHGVVPYRRVSRRS